MRNLRAVAITGAITATFGLGAATPALATQPLFKAGTYTGPTSQQHTIKFGADPSHLRALNTVLFMHCLDPEGSTYSVLHQVRTSHPIAISNGHFAGHNIPLFDGGIAQITGSLKGSNAQGNIQVSYKFNEGTDFHIVSCNGSMTWTAHFRHTGYPPYPVAKPPAVPNALFTGMNTQSDNQAVAFRTTADGDHVDDVDATIDYVCLDDGTSGSVRFTGGGDDQATINTATGYFNYSYNGPVPGLTDHAGFGFAGYFNTKYNGDQVVTPGNAASGSMRIQFTSLDGSYCTNPNSDPGWTAQVSNG